eukprot:6361514-Prorocentrum_lima.AAC.1
MRTLQKPLGPLSYQKLRQVHGALLSMKHWPSVLRFLGEYPALARVTAGTCPFPVTNANDTGTGPAL